jgi:hypothetical protein
MPPKRPFSNTNAIANDYQSPPPSQRHAHANEHHHSPIPGHHQATPADAPVAIATPPRNIRNGDENLPSSDDHSPNHIHARAAGAAIPISLPAIAGANDMISAIAATAEVQASPQAVIVPVAAIGGSARAAVIEPVAAIGGGARAAYQASQQQRVVTCNLSSIPLSE